ncbi:MAG: hypothetical protein WD823_01890 [Sulfuricaulis sp.]|uniref:phosphoribosylpyrophosphate synthetase n=1 Tax=Sulfuricaulis sp. TaxID=2003553 RepID=UPI0034A2F216
MKEPGYASEIDAIDDLRRRGYTANFQIRDNTLSEVTSGRMFRPGELVIVEHHRFEGASDPEDMSVVYAIESDDGVRGIVVDAFGVYADPALAVFLKGIKKREHV